jgi:GH24 family phage-related lysozyme (muramidase)
MARKRTSKAAAGPQLSISDDGVRLIASFEGFRSDLYNDPAGHCTIGYGHLVHLGNCDGSEPADLRKGITRKRARELLRNDAASAEAAINDAVQVPLSQEQFDALVSFVFNVGTGAFGKSTLLRRLNKGRYQDVPGQLDRWVKAGGKTLEGLVRRRKEEGELFASGTVEPPEPTKPSKPTKPTKPSKRKAPPVPVDEDETVHRDLGLTSPLTEGADVKALQHALNVIAKRFGRIVDFELDEDGKLGDRTVQATIVAGHVMGLVDSRLHDIEKQHVIAKSVQRMLREPGGRTEAAAARGKERRDELRKRLDTSVPLAAVRVAMSAGSPHWGGSNDVMAAFVEPFLVKRGLPLGSGKRTPAENKRVGGSPTSDHLTTRTTTAARDFPTFSGEDDARALAKSMGFKSWRPNSFDGFTFSAGGHSFHVQILWGAAINHADHVHVGISAA